MTGPEHYREAERLVAALKGREVKADAGQAVAAIAQVHATLALAAATCSVILSLPPDNDLAADWNVAIGATP